MANVTMEQEEKRFNKIYNYIVGASAVLLIVIVCLVFVHIPKDNQQSANMALAFCMGAFTALSGYLIGASPDKKQNNTGITQTPVPQVIAERKNDKVYRLIDAATTSSQLTEIGTTYALEMSDDPALKDYWDKAITNIK